MEFRMNWIVSLDEMGFSTDSLMDTRWGFKERASGSWRGSTHKAVIAMFDLIYRRKKVCHGDSIWWELK
jgi:hypothetical protein